jgi:hypothetical protein
MRLIEELREQRWDDHRFYHHSRVNQSLHLVSALSFIAAYYYVFVDPVVAALLGWLVAMVSRQVGHFFFEPHTYDAVNELEHDDKERIKIGYNLQRKRVLLGIWAATPLMVYTSPGLFGLLTPWADLYSYCHNLAVLWIALGIAALLGRTVQLFFIRDVRTGLAWCLKILTDPFNDVRQYWRAPLHLARGELIDPMYEVRNGGPPRD